MWATEKIRQSATRRVGGESAALRHLSFRMLHDARGAKKPSES